jgi:glucose/arabinose dehydrogenase/mono/diheme cytochrome c family protein
VVAGVGVGLVLGTCVAWRLLPERYAVNAPLDSLVLNRSIGAPSADTIDRRIRVPDGLTLSVWAEGLAGARFLRFTEAGDLLVSRPRAGEIVLLERDADGDGRSDGARVLLSGLDRPHGLDLHDGWLWIGETGAVVRVRFDAEARAVTGPAETVVPDLPPGGNHWTRTVRIGPDDRLYVTIGSDCNVCLEQDPRRAAMVRYRLDGSGEEIFATGLRNAVGFDWRPATGELYATDNGRDLLGDDFPPCELNRVVEGGFYGWPFANGDRIPDPDFGAGREAEIAASIPPVHGFRAHNAPLGMTFVRGDALPEALHGAAIVALHGSWNRTEKDGYKVVSLHFGPDGVEERDLVWGFEVDDDVIGRPVDVAEGPDGALYVSDDYAGAVYRLAPAGVDGGGAVAVAGVDGGGAVAVAGVDGGGAVAVARASRGGGDPLAALAEAERRELVAEGAALYGAHDCATCHEADAAPPGTVVKPLATLSARHDLGGLAAFLAAPTPPMPAAPLNAGQRRSLAAYLLARHP